MKTKLSMPYSCQWIEEDEINAVVSTLRSVSLTQGPKVVEFETQFAKKVGAKYAVAVSSGTAALHLCALALRLKTGDEVITTPITFLATANSILYAGARPVFADIEEKYICINPEQAEKTITERTKAVFAVDFGGHPADLEALSSICSRYGLTLIEDAAHALGAYYNGETVGNCRFSKASVFSFHPVKHITTGEGGMVTTNDQHFYERLCDLRNHGMSRKRDQFIYGDDGPWYYEMQDLGFNYRTTDIQSALGLCQLPKLELFVKRRREIAAKYLDAFSNLAGLRLPEESKEALSSYHLFVIRLRLDRLKKSRKQIFEALKEEGLGVQVHYIPITRQPYYRGLGYKPEDCPLAEAFYESAISLPLFPKMSDEEVAYVIDVVREVFQSSLIR